MPPIDAVITDLGLVAGETPVQERADWAPLRKVLVPNWDPQVLPQLRAAVPGVEFVVARDAAEAAELAPGVDAAVGFCTPEVLAAAPKLRSSRTQTQYVRGGHACQQVSWPRILVEDVAIVACIPFVFQGRLEVEGSGQLTTQ